ncbi:MAG TPA: YCF48-related protein [Ignavibacteria bacterium]
MKKILLVTFLMVVAYNANSQWFIVNHISNYQFYSLYFMSNTTGCVGGNQNGVIFKTTDSGGNFVSVPTGTSIWFLDIFFNNQLTGYACGQNGYIVKTTNGGNNWYQIFQGANFLHSIRFVDINTGYAAGYGNLIYKTTNSGSSWNLLPNNFTNTYLLSISFVDANTGFVSGENGLIGKTTNGGLNWLTISTSVSDIFEEIVMTSATTGFIAGKFGKILKTTDSGNNWAFQNSGTSEWLLDLFMMNNSRGWACGMNGKIVYTSNGGINWLTQYVPTISWIRQLHFLTPDTGYAVTDNGMILKTYNAGNPVSVNIIGSEIPKEYSLSQNFPNPFNPETKIQFGIPKSEFVLVKVYNINGQEISILVNKNLNSGLYEINFNASALSSGIYLYQIIAGDFRDLKKMVLLK